jgi:cbb3-type cytochrome oxidase subunit 1
MEWYIKAFIRAALVWLALGTLLAIGLVWRPDWLVYRPAHAHLNVAGFLANLVFGVGYQLLPRLFGHPLRSSTAAVLHLGFSQVGLAALVIGFLVAPSWPSLGRWGTVGGGLAYAAGVLLWIWNLWRTFDAADAKHRARTDTRRLPTLGQ